MKNKERYYAEWISFILKGKGKIANSDFESSAFNRARPALRFRIANYSKSGIIYT